jgi:hypothetical protein
VAAFRDIVSAASVVLAPVAVRTIPRGAFQVTWSDYPVDDPKMGFVVLADDDIQYARAQAVAYAKRMADELEERVDVFNDALMRIAVARGTTSPHDARERYFGAMAEDTVGIALTTDGVRRVYEELVAVAVERSPIRREASDEEMADLPERLAAAPPALASRLRRVIGYALDALEGE